MLDCEAGSLPFTYLGVPVGANMNLIKNRKPIINKFHAELSHWKLKTLSFRGRLTLIKKFLWGSGNEAKKIHWVAWEKIIASKQDGGLGEGSIKTLNIAPLVKWWWRLKT